MEVGVSPLLFHYHHRILYVLGHSHSSLLYSIILSSRSSSWLSCSVLASSFCTCFNLHVAACCRSFAVSSCRRDVRISWSRRWSVSWWLNMPRTYRLCCLSMMFVTYGIMAVFCIREFSCISICVDGSPFIVLCFATPSPSDASRFLSLSYYTVWLAYKLQVKSNIHSRCFIRNDRRALTA